MSVIKSQLQFSNFNERILFFKTRTLCSRSRSREDHSITALRLYLYGTENSRIAPRFVMPNYNYHGQF